MIIQDLESRDIIVVGMDDRASCLYTFSHFSPNNVVDPMIDMHTHAPSVNHVSEKFSHLNISVLSSTSALETSVELTSP